MRTLIVIVISFYTLSSYSATLTSEDIFSKAERYTLKLMTSISTPFIDDEIGTFKGTGFLIDKERGWVLTNAHVSATSPSVIVGMFKGRDYIKLNKVYVDPVVDVAVLKIAAQNIPEDATEADLDCENTYRTGHPVGAYGHPWEVSFTATRGIISGVTYLGDDEWLQVDAPINHGNSGGPLISLETGKVIGINTATASGADTQGLNFALGIESACIVMDLLKNNVNPSPVDLGMVFYKSDTNSNFKVAYVNNDINTDVQVGDIVNSVTGVDDLYTTNQLLNELRGKENHVDALIERDGRIIDIKLNLKKYPLVVGLQGVAFSGITLTKQRYIDVRDDYENGVWLVNHVTDGSPAASHDIDYWSFIEKFNGKIFHDIKSLYAYIASLSEDDILTLDVKSISESKYRLYDYSQVEIKVSNHEIITVTE